MMKDKIEIALKNSDDKSGPFILTYFWNDIPVIGDILMIDAETAFTVTMRVLPITNLNKVILYGTVTHVI